MGLTQSDLKQEGAVFAFKNSHSKGFLDGRLRHGPNICSIKSAFAEWILEGCPNTTDCFYIKNKVTSEYLYATTKSDNHEERPKLTLTKSTFGTRWQIQLIFPGHAIIKNSDIDGYLDGRHTVDIVYPRVLASMSQDYTMWTLRRIIKSSDPVLIPDRTLNNGQSWRDWCLRQTKGTCTSHAITAALVYLHGDERIMPNYIHRYTHFHNNSDMSYDNGLSIEDAMNFVNSFGVPSCPANKTIHYDQGGAFPTKTTKYTFGHIADVATAHFLESEGLVNRIKEVIQKYKLPVVVAVTSRKNTEVKFDCNVHPVIEERGNRIRNTNPGIACTNVADWHDSDKEKKVGHALLFYGFDDVEEAFYVKNSWGDHSWAGRYAIDVEGGNVRLSYSYVEQWVRELLLDGMQNVSLVT